MLTFVEVLDTAVKIGSGAAITAVTAHFHAKNTHEFELKKLALTRRLDSLEQVTERAEAHFAAWRRCASSLGGIYSGLNPPSPNFSDVQWKNVNRRDAAFLDTRDGMGLAVARLRLLGLTEAADLVRDFIKIVGDFRDRMILQKETPTHEELNAVRRKSSEKIKEFYGAISVEYVFKQQHSLTIPADRRRQRADFKC